MPALPCASPAPTPAARASWSRRPSSLQHPDMSASAIHSLPPACPSTLCQQFCTQTLVIHNAAQTQLVILGAAAELPWASPAGTLQPVAGALTMGVHQ